MWRLADCHSRRGMRPTLNVRRGSGTGSPGDSFVVGAHDDVVDPWTGLVSPPSDKHRSASARHRARSLHHELMVAIRTDELSGPIGARKLDLKSVIGAALAANPDQVSIGHREFCLFVAIERLNEARRHKARRRCHLRSRRM